MDIHTLTRTYMYIPGAIPSIDRPAPQVRETRERLLLSLANEGIARPRTTAILSSIAVHHTGTARRTLRNAGENWGLGRLPRLP